AATSRASCATSTARPRSPSAARAAPERSVAEDTKAVPRSSWRMLGLVLGTALVVWVGDLLSKEWVLAQMTEGEQRPVLGELLQWHFVRNPGAAFSFAAGSTWIFTILAAAVVV